MQTTRDIFQHEFTVPFTNSVLSFAIFKMRRTGIRAKIEMFVTKWESTGEIGKQTWGTKEWEIEWKKRLKVPVQNYL